MVVSKKNIFSHLLGEDFHFDEHIFQMGSKPPTRVINGLIDG